MDDKPLILMIDTAHLSTRELALRAIYGQGEKLVVLDDLPPRPTELEMPAKVRAPKATFQRAPKRREYEKQKSASLKRLLAK